MKEEKNEFKIENRHIRSLVCIMFFPRIVHFLIRSNDYELSNEDKNFIKWYIKYWFIILIIILFAIVFWVLSVMTNLLPSIFSLISKILTFIWIAMIITWIFMIFSEKSILQWKTQIKYKKIESWNIDLIFYYIPIYNIYLWYSNPNMSQYWWIKESIIFWYLWAIIVLLTQSIWLWFLLLIFLFIRIVSVIWWIDFIHDKYKEKADKFFEKNPEEIFAYIKWPIIFLYNKLISWWKYTVKWIIEEIEQNKKEYSNIKNIEYTTNKAILIQQKEIVWEYILLIIFLYFIFNNLLLFIQTNIYWNILILAFIFIIWRFIVSLYIKKLPFIPVSHEIILIIKRLINFLK